MYLEESTKFRDDLYCPSCGSSGIFEEELGDYYEGGYHYCFECGVCFTMPTLKDMDVRMIGRLLGK